MKKIILASIAFVATSIALVAGQFDFLEDLIELKFQNISDGNKNYTLDDVDVEIFNGQPYVKLEIEGFSGDAGWSDFDKEKYKAYATGLANFVREQLSSDTKVRIALILDCTIGKDRLLEDGLY
ncbi:MAG: hypothetical protein K6B46_04125 [Opitutales bacterium]|nr:hypothetical protein [Opitutales bacterium]